LSPDHRHWPSQSHRSKTYAKKLVADVENGGKQLAELRKRNAEHPVEVTGKKLRDLMSWGTARSLRSLNTFGAFLVTRPMVAVPRWPIRVRVGRSTKRGSPDVHVDRGVCGMGRGW